MPTYRKEEACSEYPGCAECVLNVPATVGALPPDHGGGNDDDGDDLDRSPFHLLVLGKVGIPACTAPTIQHVSGVKINWFTIIGHNISFILWPKL